MGAAEAACAEPDVKSGWRSRRSLESLEALLKGGGGNTKKYLDKSHKSNFEVLWIHLQELNKNNGIFKNIIRTVQIVVILYPLSPTKCFSDKLGFKSHNF